MRPEDMAVETASAGHVTGIRQRRHHSRHLAESPLPSEDPADVPANVSVVWTATAFQRAIAAGAQDVVVRAHLDLTTLGLDFDSYNVLAPIKSTRSIRGNCEEPPPSAAGLGLYGPPLQWQTPQCVIIVDPESIAVTGPVWLDALYIRPRGSRGALFPLLDISRSTGVYVTRVLLQGDGVSRMTAAYVHEWSKLYMRGSGIDSMHTQTSFFGLVEVWDSAVVLDRVSVSNIAQDTAAQYRDAVDEIANTPWPALANAPPPFVSDLLRPDAVELEYGAYSPDGLLSGWYADYEAAPAPQGELGLDVPPYGVMDVFGDVSSLVALNTSFANVTSWHGRMFRAVAGGIVIAEDLTGAAAEVYTGPQSRPFNPYKIIPAEPASLLQDLPEPWLQPPGPQDPWYVALRQSVLGAAPAQFRVVPDVPLRRPLPPPPSVPGGARPEIAAVYTAEQLQRALHAGVRDIEIRSHLDLRGLPAWVYPEAEAPEEFADYGYSDGYDYKPLGGADFQLGRVHATTRSIRGRCTDPPPLTIAKLSTEESAGAPAPGASLQRWRAPRCVLVTAEPFLVADTATLWLDSLHITATERDDHDYDYSYGFLSRRTPFVLLISGWASVYVSNSVVVDLLPGPSSSSAIRVQTCGGGLFMRDSVITGTANNQGTLVAALYGTAFFRSCLFVDDDWDNEVDTSYYIYGPFGHAAIQASGRNGTVALQNCTLDAGPGYPSLAILWHAKVFSDVPMPAMIQVPTGPPVASEPLASMHALWPRTPRTLMEDDPWFIAAQQALSNPPPSAYITEYHAAGGPSAPAPEPVSVGVTDAAPAAATATSAPGEIPAQHGYRRGADDGGMSAAAVLGVALGVLLVASVFVSLLVVAAARAWRRQRGPRPGAARKVNGEVPEALELSKASAGLQPDEADGVPDAALAPHA
eukprot:jgi/Ulvmu1/3684/UM017_0100.1